MDKKRKNLSTEDYKRLVFGNKRKKFISKKRKQDRILDAAIKTHIHLISSLMSTNKDEQKQAMIENMDQSQLKAVTTVIRKILENDYTIPEDLMQKLSKYGEEILEFYTKNTSGKRKKEILAQKGGFLGAALLPLAAKIAGPLLGGLLQM